LLRQLTVHHPYFTAGGDAGLFWLRQAFRVTAVALALLHLWAAAASHSMNPDGVSYLDIGDAYFRGDWEAAISTVWSPLYSWILGAALWLLRPPMQWEFPAVHLVNFVVFLGSLRSFEFMWSQLAQARPATGIAAEKVVALPEWSWWSVGYLLFIWSSLSLIHIWAVTPDMLMAAFVFLAAGLVARIRAGHDTFATFAWLGCVLGLGYLTKTVMLPVSLFFLAAAWYAVPNLRRAVSRASFAIFFFLLVIAPFILLMSSVKGRFTYGEAGKLTYVRHVNGVVDAHWQGEVAGHGVPLNPSRRIFDEPRIYEFGDPIGGTYPISYDPAYWFEGVTIHFDPANQATQLMAGTLFYTDLFIYQQAALLLSIALIYALSWWPRQPLSTVVRSFLLSLAALMALLLYLPVLVAGRYVGAFVVVFWTDLLANAGLPGSRTSRKLISILSIFMMAFLLVNIAVFNLNGFADLTAARLAEQPGATAAGPPTWPGAVAEELWRLGVEPADKVGVIGYAFDSYWARLARVKIVAEMYSWEADSFWLGSPSFQEEVLQAFAATGARAVVAEYVPPYATLRGWYRVELSNYYIFLLDEAWAER
jgi:hypothetical protein